MVQGEILESTFPSGRWSRLSKSNPGLDQNPLTATDLAPWKPWRPKSCQQRLPCSLLCLLVWEIIRVQARVEKFRTSTGQKLGTWAGWEFVHLQPLRYHDVPKAFLQHRSISQFPPRLRYPRLVGLPNTSSPCGSSDWLQSLPLRPASDENLVVLCRPGGHLSAEREFGVNCW